MSTKKIIILILLIVVLIGYLVYYMSNKQENNIELPPEACYSIEDSLICTNTQHCKWQRHFTTDIEEDDIYSCMDIRNADDIEMKQLDYTDDIQKEIQIKEGKDFNVIVTQVQEEEYCNELSPKECNDDPQCQWIDDLELVTEKLNETGLAITEMCIPIE